MDCSYKIIACIIILLLYFSGFLYSGYVYIDEYNEFNCGNLKACVTLALIALILFAINFIMFISSCCTSTCYKILLFISCLFIGFATVFNIYYYNQISDECIEYYREEELWEYYNILLFTLCITCMVSIIFVACACCS